MSNKEQACEIYMKLKQCRQNIRLPKRLDDKIQYCQFILESKLIKNSRQKNKKVKFQDTQLPLEFRTAYKALSLEEKLSYYCRHIQIIKELTENPNSQHTFILNGILFDYAYARSFSLKIWRQKNLRLNKTQKVLYAQYQKEIKVYNLIDYIMRASKNTQYYSFVLEAINTNVHERSQTIHLGFKQQQKYNIWHSELSAVYKLIEWQSVSSEIRSTLNNTELLSNSHYVSNKNIPRNKKSPSILDDQQLNFDKPRKNNQHEEQQQSWEVKLTRSVIVDREEKSQVVVDVDEFNSIQNLNQSDRGYASLATVANDLQAFSFTKSNNLEEIDSSKSPQQILQRLTSRNHDESQKPRKQTIIESIADIDMEQIQQMQDQDHFPRQQIQDNIFHKIFPEYDLREVENYINYNVIVNKDNLKLMQHLEKPQKIKMILKISSKFNPRQVLAALTNPQLSLLINTEIQVANIKTLVKSQNSAMIYFKIKPYNRLYRSRDFIFLRHVFQYRGIYYIADKSITNINYPPFTTIVRGEMTSIWTVRRQNIENQDSPILAICESSIQNNGYLKQSQNINLTVKYYEGFCELEDKLNKLNAFYEVFLPNWAIKIDNKFAQFENSLGKSKKKSIKKHQSNKDSPKKINKEKKAALSEHEQADKKFKENDQKISQETTKSNTQLELNALKYHQILTLPEKQQNYNIFGKQEQPILEKGQMTLEEVLQQENMKKNMIHQIQRDFNQEGHVIISNNFIHTKYITVPLPKGQINYLKSDAGHPIWKGQWRHDDDIGAIIFINQKKIDDQKNVLKFILANVGKNLLSGKSIMNISLPVDIFSAQSNLELLMYSLSYAPTKLQPVSSIQTQTLHRFKNVIAFCISNSPLYLNMQKPFNPILGETFQCYLDGCPGYVQQISHHPPIAAICLQGRGYRITGQFQSKIQLHLNSGCGTNDGTFTIQFNDGMKVCYITPGGEVSGLSYGDRKFNMVGKGYVWIESEGIFLELIFNPTEKGFFSLGKQEKPIDYFEGNVFKVKPEFFKKFLSKKKSPVEKQIIDKLGKVHGIWNQYIKFDQEIIFDIEKEHPVKLEYEVNPLPSDSNWRQDIAYRRLMQVSKSQSEKQRLEIFQRKDRKLRQKWNPKKH